MVDLPKRATTTSNTRSLRTTSRRGHNHTQTLAEASNLHGRMEEAGRRITRLTRAHTDAAGQPILKSNGRRHQISPTLSTSHQQTRPTTSQHHKHNKTIRTQRPRTRRTINLPSVHRKRNTHKHTRNNHNQLT